LFENDAEAGMGCSPGVETDVMGDNCECCERPQAVDAVNVCTGKTS
jgi:hypothetical protein